MRDEKLILIADSATPVTASGNGTTLDLMIGTSVAKYYPTGSGVVDQLGSNGISAPLAAVIDVSAITGNGSIVYALQSADDQGFSLNVTTLGTTASIAAAGEYIIPFQTSKRFLRLAGTVTGPFSAFVSARVGDRPYA